MDDNFVLAWDRSFPLTEFICLRNSINLFAWPVAIWTTLVLFLFKIISPTHKAPNNFDQTSAICEIALIYEIVLLSKTNCVSCV